MAAPRPNANDRRPKPAGPPATSTVTDATIIGATITGATAAAAPTASGTTLAKHSIVIAGHRTSISLERAFWDRLGEVAADRRCSVAGLVAEIDQGRGDANLSSAIRVFLLAATTPRR